MLLKIKKLAQRSIRISKKKVTTKFDESIDVSLKINLNNLKVEI